VNELRRVGLSAELDAAGRSLKGQMKHADRIGARKVAILEGDAATVRDMSTGDQRQLSVSDVADSLRSG